MKTLMTILFAATLAFANAQIFPYNMDGDGTDDWTFSDEKAMVLSSSFSYLLLYTTDTTQVNFASPVIGDIPAGNVDLHIKYSFTNTGMYTGDFLYFGITTDGGTTHDTLLYIDADNVADLGDDSIITADLSKYEGETIQIEGDMKRTMTSMAILSVEEVRVDFPTSTKVLENVAFNVYPNPASDVLNIEGLVAGASVEVIDLTGRVVISTNSLRNIDMSTLQNGVYALRISNGETIISQTIIKQ